ncbi:probable beta-hexosaminidase fdl isoform X2 [Photinus pyralis]|uniref:probable beta-hexosaminidase fdl isoform X2 n=1 Tax=Photinus pyralis TaxID=7054 RepID=UPI0012674FE7|nr:probable beta-hexosaminidase fdl isoform X2 [Photinus pyralis]
MSVANCNRGCCENMKPLSEINSEIVRPLGLKKVLYFLLLMCGVLIFYLMRHQFTSSRKHQPRLSAKHQETITKSPQDGVWTWKCQADKCQRHAKTPEDGQSVSLTTCNMLCGNMQLWPSPTGPVTLGSRGLIFSLDQIHLETVLVGPVKDLLDKAFASFVGNVEKLTRNKNGDFKHSDINKFRVYVNVINSDITKLQIGTNESYSLTLKTIDTDLVASIKASTFFGARHALETLSQLIWWDEFAHGGVLKVLKIASISDSPAFPYRGIMVDTARNFIPIESIKRVLTGMAANKLNVFHWHITDSQSFPFASPRVPKMSKFGAYSSDMVYHPEDIKDVVDYARVRGIRVVIEIDTPAHAGNGWNWGPTESLGDLAVCVNQQPWSAYCGEPPCGQLNPTNPNMYNVLEKLYKDILDLSEETEIFHLGGDEVNLECWGREVKWNNPKTNYTDLHDLWGVFTLKALERLKNANGGRLPKYVVMWSSNLSKKPYTSKYLNKHNIIIQAWGPFQWGQTTDLLQEGYRLIISHVDAWYLDCGFGRWRETGEAACDPYRTWQSIYSHRPWESISVSKEKILGGEACLWSEQVDSDSLDGRLWPRAAAFAERVWTDPVTNQINGFALDENVYTRLSTQRDRLVERGLIAEAIWPQWCTQNPGMCL